MFTKEFFDESIHTNNKLLIVNNDENDNLFKNFLKAYLSKKKGIIGFDLEFNTPPKSSNERKIALFQICFFLNNLNLIVFYLPEFASDETNILFRRVLTSKNISKIGHGTDSLDIPAIYKLLNDGKSCIKFTNKLYDTRFLCEYINILLGTTHCNIYHLLQEYAVITVEQYNFLKINEEKLGDFWMKIIDINNLSDELIDYSMYDALYLKKLCYNMKNFINSHNFNFELITKFTRLVFLLKRDIIHLPDVSEYNINFMQNKKKLFEIFANMYNNFLSKLNKSVSAIFQISYFKNTLKKILQIVCYKKIINNNNVYKSKDIVINPEKINKVYNDFFKSIKKYKKLISIFEKI